MKHAEFENKILIEKINAKGIFPDKPDKNTAHLSHTHTHSFD